MPPDIVNVPVGIVPGMPLRLKLGGLTVSGGGGITVIFTTTVSTTGNSQLSLQSPIVIVVVSVPEAPSGIV